MPLTAGEVAWHGGASRGMPKRVGYMLQKDLLLPWRTALGNVTLGLEIHDVPGARAGRAGAPAARHDRPQRLPRLLSGGAFRRHAPARGSGAHARQRAGGAPARRAFRRARFPDQARARERHGAAGAQPAPLAPAHHPRRRGGGLALRPGHRADPPAGAHPGRPRDRHRRRPHRHDGRARVAALHATTSARSGASSRSRPGHERRGDATLRLACVEPDRAPPATARAACAGTFRALRGSALVLRLPDRACSSCCSPPGNSPPPRPALSAFLFGSPSAIWGFLVKMWQDGSLFTDTESDRAGDASRLRHRQRARHADRPRALVFALRLAGRAALHRRARLDPDHRARADLHHLVRHRARLEGRDGDAVGGRRRADHRLQGRHDRRSRPDQPDAHAGRLEAPHLPQADRARLARRHFRRTQAHGRLRADRRHHRRIHVLVRRARPRDLQGRQPLHHPESVRGPGRDDRAGALLTYVVGKIERLLTPWRQTP